MAILVEKIEKIIKIGPETAEIEHFHSRNGDFEGAEVPNFEREGPNLGPLKMVVLTIFENLPGDL